MRSPDLLLCCRATAAMRDKMMSSLRTTSKKQRIRVVPLLLVLLHCVVNTQVEAGCPRPPYRIWASPYNFSSAERPELEQRFRGANVLLNSDVQPTDVARYMAAVRRG